MTYQILSTTVASITDLKKNPMQTIKEGHGRTIAILNRNEPVFYCVPPLLYDQMMDIVDDEYLRQVVKSREGEEGIEVDINDL